MCGIEPCQCYEPTKRQNRPAMINDNHSMITKLIQWCKTDVKSTREEKIKQY